MCMIFLKKIVAVLFISALSYNAYSQDILFKKDGTKDTVIVKEVNSIEVVYKKYRRPDGPTYRIYKSKLLLIEYADGTIEVYNKKNTSATIKTDESSLKEEKLKAELGRSILSLNYLNIINGNAHLGYERITKEGNLGIKLSINLNIDNTEDGILKYQRDFTTGLDLNFYPTGQGKIKYFFGPSFRVGTVSERFNSDIRGSVIDYYRYLGLFFNNGFNIQPTTKLNIGFQWAAGVGRFRNKQLSSNLIEVDGIIAFNIGYRF